MSEQKKSIEELKVKYGKVYKLSASVPVDDDTSTEFVFHFKRPSVPSYDRYVKTASSGITKASKAFLLDAVVEEETTELAAAMEENPGIAISIGNKLTEILGLTGNVNLKML